MRVAPSVPVLVERPPCGGAGHLQTSVDSSVQYAMYVFEDEDLAHTATLPPSSGRYIAAILLA